MHSCVTWWEILMYWVLQTFQVWTHFIQFSSVAQSCPALCNPVDCSMPGLPVHHQLPEFTQTHVHRVGDAIQQSHPVVPFSSCLQSFPASGSFPISQLFESGGQSIGVSASASALPMNIQDWFLLGWTGWISLLSKGLSIVSSNTTVQNLQFFGTSLSLEKEMATHSSILAWKTPQTEKPGWATDHGVTKSQTQLKWLNTHTKTAFFIVQLSYPYMTTGKTIALTRQTFVSKVMSLLCLFIQYQKMCYLLTLCCVVLSCSFVSYSLQPHRLFTSRLLCPWNFSGKNTGVVCDFFL